MRNFRMRNSANFRDGEDKTDSEIRMQFFQLQENQKDREKYKQMRING